MLHMRRREFIAMLGGAAATWPLAARAQQVAMPVIGFVNAGSPKGYARPLSAFLKGLAETGYVEGRNVAIEYRWAEGQYDRLPAFVADFVNRKVNLIAGTSTQGGLAAKAATSTIPIVFTTSGDPVQLGFVTSLSRPDGNITGAAQLNVEVAPKRLELMHEVLPTAANIGLLVNPTSALTEPVSRELQAAAATRHPSAQAPCPQRQQRAGLRRGLCDLIPTASRGARDRRRCVLHQPKRRTRRINGPPPNAGDLPIP
jgi:ABC-type uncharacterized transport system substrate-binding protein